MTHAVTALAKKMKLSPAMTGVLVLLKVDDLEVRAEWFAGDLLTLTNASSFAFFLVISKRTIERLGSVPATAGLLAWGALGAAFTPIILLGLYWRRLTRWGALASLIVGPLVIVIWYNVTPLHDAVYELIPAFVLSALAAVAGPSGPWAEEYFCFWEDLELGWRLVNSGWRIESCPQAVASHRRGAGAAVGSGPPPAISRTASARLRCPACTSSNKARGNQRPAIYTKSSCSSKAAFKRFAMAFPKFSFTKSGFSSGSSSATSGGMFKTWSSKPAANSRS